jgi:hypothetical protein
MLARDQGAFASMYMLASTMLMPSHIHEGISSM